MSHLCDGYINQVGGAVPPLECILSQTVVTDVVGKSVDHLCTPPQVPELVTLKERASLGFTSLIEEARKELDKFATASTEDRKSLRKPIDIYRRISPFLRDNRLEVLFTRKRELKGLLSLGDVKEWSDELAFVMNAIESHEPLPAHGFLRELLLATNAPTNELEQPSYIDHYTNVEDDNSDMKALQEQMVLFEAGELTLKEEIALEEAIFDSLDDWNRYLFDRMYEVYPDETAGLAIEANWQWVGTEEIIDVFEDRGHVPDTFAPSLFVTDQYGLLMSSPAYKGLTHLMELTISHAVATAKGKTPTEWEFSVRQTVNEGFTHRWSNHLIQAWADDYEPQDLWMAIKRFFHNVGLNSSHLTEIKLPSGETLYEWIEENEKDLDPFESPPILHSYTPSAEIEDIADQWLEEIFSMHDERSIARSRPYVEAFWEAQMSGQARPSDAGWANWRRITSPAGAEAYNLAIDQGATRTQAMREFYMKMPKVVSFIRRDGLILADKRKVTWSTAIQIQKNEGFVELERLTAKLKELGFGARFVTATMKPALEA